MEKRYSSVSINLLKEKKISFLDKFINWALTFGRLIVIVTETIALSSFLYRFSLDRKLIDLHEKIKQKETIIRIQKPNELKYRDIQERLTLISRFDEDGQKTKKIFADILYLIPEGFTFNNFLLSNESIKITGRAQSIENLKNFIEALKAYPLISNISLDHIENKTSNAAIIVSITTTLVN